MSPTPPLDPATILIVDDHPVLLQTVSRLVEQLGHRPVVAGTAQQAVAILQREPVAAVLTDVNLGAPPNGLALIQMIRREAPDVPTVLMTGSPPEGAVPQGVERLDKPFRMSDLAALLARILPARVQG